MGCGAGVLGTLVVILGVVIYALVSSFLNRLFISARFGNESAGAVFSLFFTGLTVAFLLYEAIFIFGQIKLSQERSSKDNEKKLKKIYIIVFAVCVTLSLAFAVFSANTFTELRSDSISKVCFTTTKEYRWDTRNDVYGYTFSCDENGGIAFSVKMKDGEIIEVLGGVNSLSDAFKQEYNTDSVNLLSYAAHLSDQLDNSEYIIDKKIIGVEFMEQHFKENNPEIWAEICKIID